MPCVFAWYLFQNDFFQYGPHGGRQKDPQTEQISAEYKALQVFQQYFHQLELALGQTLQRNPDNTANLSYVLRLKVGAPIQSKANISHHKYTCKTIITWPRD